MTDRQAAEPTELVIVRELRAQRELVFQAFTNPEHLVRWWGPEGFEIVVVRKDIRPGGIFHYKQRSPEGDEMWCKLAYDEIEPPERIVFTNGFSDEEGRTARAPFHASWPLEIRNTITFAEQDGLTTLKMRGTPVNPTAEELKTFSDEIEMVREGFSATFQRLDDYLAKS